MTKFSKLSKFLAITTTALSVATFFNSSKIFASCNYDVANKPICKALDKTQVDEHLNKETIINFKKFVGAQLNQFSKKVETYKQNNPNKDKQQMDLEELEKTATKIKKKLDEILKNNTVTTEEIKATINIVSDNKPLDENGINLVIEYFDLVRVIFIEAGGGFGLPDPIKYKECNKFEGCLGTPNGKMNDSAILKSYITTILLDNYTKYGTFLPKKNLEPLETSKRIFTILGIKPDNSIKIPEHLKEKLNHLNYLLTDIETVPATGENIGKGLDNQIYDTYPGASSYHSATLKSKKELSQASKDLNVNHVNFFRESFQTGDSNDRKHRTPCVMMNKEDKEALKFAQKYWAPLAKYRFDSYPIIEVSRNVPVEIPKIYVVQDDERNNRWVPRTSKEGITTLLNWKITDTIDLQAHALDEKVIWHEAILEALAIARYSLYDPRVSNVLLEPIKEENKNNETIVKGIRISVNVSGEDVDKLSEGSLVISRADDPTKKLEIKGQIKQYPNDNKYYLFHDDEKSRLNDDKKANEFDIKLKDLDKNLDWQKEINNEYYLNVYAENEEIPCQNVCSFKVKPKDRYFIEDSTEKHERLKNVPVIETNTVTQKTLQDKIKKQQKNDFEAKYPISDLDKVD